MSVYIGTFSVFFFLIFVLGSQDLFHWIRAAIPCRFPVPICKSVPYEPRNLIFHFYHMSVQRQPTFSVIYKPIVLQNHSQKMDIDLKFPILMSFPKVIDSQPKKSRMLCPTVQIWCCHSRRGFIFPQKSGFVFATPTGA